MNAYFYYLKMRLLTEISYRFDVFSSIGSNIIILLTTVYIWKAAYQSSSGSVKGITESEMISYTIVSILLTIIFTNSIQDTLNDRIREGNIAVDFLRPINLLVSFFADEVGRSVSSLLTKGIPILLVASIIFKVPLPNGIIEFLLFILSSVCSFIILWLISAIVGVLAFWVVELGNLGMVKDAIVLFLSGSFVPLWFYPEAIQTLSKYLPFIYTYMTPISIFIGKLSFSNASVTIGIQIIWIFFFSGILLILWNKAKTRTFIQGG